MRELDQTDRVKLVALHPLAGIPTAINELAQSMLPALKAFLDGIRAISLPEVDTGPQHPMLAAIEDRKTRNTGPEQRMRAPRRIDR